MKNNLLKQSVIAVLVGGGASALALAQVQEIDTNNNSGVTFTKGIRNTLVVAIQGNLQILNGFKKAKKFFLLMVINLKKDLQLMMM